jgi:hypothetical protein
VYDAVANGDDLVEHPEDYLMMCYRGTGRAVSLKEVYLYAKDYTTGKAPKEASVIGMDITVEYVHEDYQGYDNPDTVTKKITLQPPTELLTGFSKIKFANWVKKVKAKRIAETKEKDLTELKRLKEKYPND